jgi:hypothetical protein
VVSFVFKVLGNYTGSSREQKALEQLALTVSCLERMECAAMR